MKQSVLVIMAVISLCFLSAQTDPEWVWAHGGGSVNVDSGRGVSTDSLGNCYLAGWYNGAATFGPLSLTSNAASNDVVVIKMNPAGEILWAVSAGGIYSDNAYAITTLPGGISLVTGEFYGTASFGTNTISAGDAAGAFVAAISPTGEWLWANSASGSGFGEERGYGIAADEFGNGYVTGYIKGNASFGSLTVNTSSGDDPAAFVAKIGAGGVWNWVVTGGGTSWANPAQAYAVATDRNGHVYFTGYYLSTFDIGLGSLTSNGSGDVFIACLNYSGQPLWARGAGGNSVDVGAGIAADPDGNCYVTGYFENTTSFGQLPLTGQGGTDIFVTKLASNGDFLWARQAGGNSSDQAKGIAADSDGCCYIAGYYAGAAGFGTFALNSIDYTTDIFAAKLDSFGNWVWAESAGSNAEEYAMGVGCDNAGNCYVTGNYSGTVMFGDNQVTGNYLDIFIAKHSSAAVGNNDQTGPQSLSLSVLYDAYPNPVRSGQDINIKTDLAKGDTGTLSLYNLRGQKLASYPQKAGENLTNVNTGNLPSGMYFYRLKTNSVNTAGKLLILN